MNRKTGKQALCVAFLTIVLLSKLAYGSESTILRCEAPSSQRGESDVYQVVSEMNRYALLRLVNGREVARIALERGESVVGYGGTFLFTQNLGRSGYLLIYFHRPRSGTGAEKSLVDVNLFQEPMRPLNSGSPRTDFSCKSVS